MMKHEPSIHFFDPFDDLDIHSGELPHWTQKGVLYFVTFRLADSLPNSKLVQLKKDREDWIQINKNKQRYQFTKEDWEQYNDLFHKRVETWLEAGYGSCSLNNEEVLKCLIETLYYFDGKRYLLDSYVIMPNHEHLIVQPLINHTLSQITHSWKSYSANKINKLIYKSGQLWQHESYDHIIRNEESLQNFRKYIKLNPIKAKINLHDGAIKLAHLNVPVASNVAEASQLQELNNSKASQLQELNNSKASQLQKINTTKAGSFGYILSILFLLFSSLAQAQNEAYYINLVNEIEFKGKTEVKLTGGRADIVNEEYAIEVEWANNWKNSIGQSLWYALQTNKKPGIVVLMKTLEDRKYGIMLQSAIDYAGLTDKIKVWFYPEDFGRSFGEETKARIVFKENLIEKNGNYTRNKNSNIRHNSRCSDFDCKSCVPCGPDDGIACGKCKG